MPTNQNGKLTKEEDDWNTENKYCCRLHDRLTWSDLIFCILIGLEFFWWMIGGEKEEVGFFLDKEDEQAAWKIFDRKNCVSLCNTMYN